MAIKSFDEYAQLEIFGGRVLLLGAAGKRIYVASVNHQDYLLDFSRSPVYIPAIESGQHRIATLTATPSGVDRAATPVLLPLLTVLYMTFQEDQS